MHVEVHTWPVNNIQREREGYSSSDQEWMVGKKSWRWKRAEYPSDSVWNVQHVFSMTCTHMFLWQHSLISLPRRTYTLKDTGFPHGIELLDGIVLLVEVSVGLFPGLCYCVLLGKVRFIHRFCTSPPPEPSSFSSGWGSMTGSVYSISPTGMVLDSHMILSPWRRWLQRVRGRKQWAGEISGAWPAAPSSLV